MFSRLCRSLVVLFAFLSLFAWAPPPAAWAQSVRRSDTSFGRITRAGNNAAENQSRPDWPVVDEGETGTQIYLSFDLRNADVILITSSDSPLDAVMNEARGIAAALHLPKTDYIYRDATKITGVDLEFNDYLQPHGDRRTDFELPLGKLAQAMGKSKLPRPIVLLVEGDECDRVTLVNADGATRTIADNTFLALSDIEPDARLQFTATMVWYAPIFAVGLGAMIAFTFATVVTMPWTMARAKRKREAEEREKRAKGEDDAPPDPTEVQEKYNKQKPLWLIQAMVFAPALLLLPLMVSGAMKRGLDDAMYLLPIRDLSPRVTLLALPLLLGIGALSAGLCKWTERKRARLAPSPLPPKPADEDTPPQWTQMVSLYVLFGAMALMPLLLSLPPTMGRPVRLALVFGFMGVAFVSAIVVNLWAANKNRTRLLPDDPWHDMTQTMAQKAGVRVGRVTVTRSPDLNAFATPWGTVGFTSALLRRLEPNEVRAIAAHEIGHLKAGHARANLLYALLFGVAWVALSAWAIPSLKSHLSPEAYALIRSPFPAFFLPSLLGPLLFGRGRRKREEEADRFAAEILGDPELVIQALRKIHTLSGQPHHLRKSDEALQYHPSLAHRIDALRRLPTETNRL